MASVTSLTYDKIQELVSGWEGVTIGQSELNGLVQQLWNSNESQYASLSEFRNAILPALQAELDAGSIRVSDLNATIPDLETKLDQHDLSLTNLNEVDIPALQLGIANNTQNLIDSPKVYTQPDEPTNPDVDERFLVPGDVWYDSDDNNMQRIWDGVEWTTFKVDVADFSLTVKKLLSTKHMIY